jgi:hypothetical protein
MHDPSHLAFEIKRPFPKRSSMKRIGGRRHVYWPSMVDVWHDEPGGRDAGTKGGCGYAPKGWRVVPWLLRHRRHLHVNVWPVKHADRWLHLRCGHCNGKHRRYSPVNVSHGWGGDGPVYHSACSAMISFKSSLDEAREALRLAKVDSLSLELAGMDSTKAWRVVHYANQQ